jgi:polar amino acid transport system permease protein
MLLSAMQWEFLARGALLTVGVALMSFILALVVAFTTGLALIARVRIVRLVATIYVEIFRGSSALVQIYFIFFVFPLFGVELPPILAGVLTLGLNFGAYGGHIVRATIQAIDRGQWEVATALNMPYALAMRRIILPQALIAMIPLFGNELIRILKATSLLSAVTIGELTFAGNTLVAHTGQPTPIFTAVLLIYFAVAFPLATAVKKLEGPIQSRFGVAPRRFRDT